MAKGSVQIEAHTCSTLPGGLDTTTDTHIPTPEAVLGIYRYHTGMDRFSDYKSLVLVCGLQSGLGQF